MPEDVARALAASRTSADGPRGQVSLYAAGDGWQSWIAPDRPLALHGAPRFGDMRTIMGNYATHSPLVFVALLLGLTVVSAMIAVFILLVTRRGGGS